MATITALEIQKRHPDRVNIELDGEFALGVAGILAVGLKVGQTLEATQVAALKEKDTEETAFQRALRLLSLRERSEAELRIHLRKSKIPEHVLERTLKRLREHQHTDDARFARVWVENRVTFRPRGQRALAWELRRKGVAPALVEQAVSTLDESTLAHQAGLKKARQLESVDWQNFRTKLSSYLARRGFPASVISETVSKLWTETHPRQPSFHEEDIP